MKLNVQDIKINPISFSYVIVWKKTLNNIPPFSAEFCKTLFGQPDNTDFGFNQQGLSISIKPANLPPPQMAANSQNNIIIQIGTQPDNVVLGYQRFSIFSKNQEVFFEAYKKLIDEIKKFPSFFSNLQSRQVGINIEFEIVFNDTGSLKKWSLEKFFPENKDNSITEFNLQQFRYQAVEENNSKFVMVTLSPNMSNSQALHCLINDHYGISPTEMIFDLVQIKNYISKTIDKTTSVIIPAFINDHEA